MDIDIKLLVALMVIWTILIILVVLEYDTRITINEQLTGFWKAPLAFCTKSGIGSFMLNFIDNTVYLLMLSSNNEVLLNKCVEYEKEACEIFYLTSRDDQGTYSFELEFSGGVLPLPEEVVLKFNPKKGMLHFVDEDNGQILLEAFKDCSATVGVV